MSKLLVERFGNDGIIEIIEEGKEEKFDLTSGLRVELRGDKYEKRLFLRVYEDGALIEDREMDLFGDFLITRYLTRARPGTYQGP